MNQQQLPFALLEEMDPSEGKSRRLWEAGSAAPRFLAQCHVPLNSTVWVYEGHSSTVKLVYHTWPWGTPTGRLLPQSTGSYIVPRD